MKLFETFNYPGWPEGAPITDDLIRENIRVRRDDFLKNSDWTQLADSPLSEADRSAWAAYRQELRDLPQVSDPRSIDNWPTPPTA
jgi:hypothetical protein